MSNNYVDGVRMNLPGLSRRGGNAPAGLLSLLFLVAAILSAVQAARLALFPLFWVAGVLALVSLLIPMALKMANQWERAVVLRMGRL
ncbi:MAG TPA: hypothetical protein VHN39_09500, partial [Phenylobacterium sp.]|nr:hypothetical protein [Phenylobacterium sp.]